jgi:hypothetical protein
MNDPLQALLQQTGSTTPAFPPNSRYHATPIGKLALPGGREVAYLKRRLVPPPENFSTLQEHIVAEGDRLDLIAARYLDDPEQYWQLCDANGVLRPDDLTDEIGRRIRITSPENISGAT